MSRVHLDKLIIAQLVNKFCSRRFSTVITRSRNWNLSRARLIHSTPLHTISLRFICILSTHLCLGIPNDLFHSGIQNKISRAFLISLIHATCLANLPLLDFIILKYMLNSTEYEALRCAVLMCQQSHVLEKIGVYWKRLCSKLTFYNRPIHKY